MTRFTKKDARDFLEALAEAEEEEEDDDGDLRPEPLTAEEKEILQERFGPPSPRLDRFTVDRSPEGDGEADE